VLKWFGCDLGAQTKYDKKAGTCIVNGAHDAGALAEKLEGFIKKYVQCYSCGNPETVVKIKKENILLKCKACGFVSEVDARLKLNTFILKNPPENKLSKAEKKVKKAQKEAIAGLEVEAPPLEGGDREKKKKKKSSSKKRGDGDGPEDSAEANGGGDDDDEEEEDEEEDGNDVVWLTDTSAAAMEARAAEQLSAATAALVTQGNVEAELAEARKREEKRAAEEEAAAAAAEAECLAAEAEQLALNDPATKLKALVAAGAGPSEVAAAVGAVEGGPAARMRALYAALFAGLPDDERLAPAVTARAAYLALHSADPAGQLAQLVAVEHFVGVAAPGRAKEAPLVLKAMYDADLAEEGLILAWFAKRGAGGVLGVPSAAADAVRAAAKPFVEWLEEAESDEEGSEEGDSE
jgi:translation initiation factor 5